MNLAWHAGTSSEVMPGQWSFKVGPCKGAEIGDQVWMARYLLSRCSEKFNLKSSLDPKPVPGDWPICGAFVKYSTTATRCVSLNQSVLLCTIFAGHCKQMSARHFAKGVNS